MESKAAENRPLFFVKRHEPSIVRPSAPSVEAGCSDYYHLSVFDRIQVGYFSILYRYAPPQEPAKLNVTAVLRQSLAKVLVHYHPLAGRITRDEDGNLVVKLSGEGVLFAEAEADGAIPEVPISDFDPQTQENLLYPESTWKLPDEEEEFRTPLLRVQVTKFSCGGLILGVLINHHIMDGIGAAALVASWAEMARGVPLSKTPFLDPTILKPRSMPKPDFALAELQADALGFDRAFKRNMGDRVASGESHAYKEFAEKLQKSLWFDVAKIDQLKSQADRKDGNGCTSFEALAGLVWRSWVSVKAPGGDELMKLLITVNFRHRLEPPLPGGYAGNAHIVTHAECRARELLDSPLASAAGLVREAVRRVTDSRVRAAIDCLYERPLAGQDIDGNTLFISSWARLDVWAADFGWGQPDGAGMGLLLPPMGMFFIPAAGGRGQHLKLALSSADFIKFKELTEGCEAGSNN